eukprot:Plantae.Rhodophyta-Purpureofilum_apyrenoidigerum.ctg17750.p1 GENE.Plantae.Rhodophyta-Purpureofilum_apyrenoidigerum.ctg17750~~Plantae.Rhodophyta-Purpureofilum_apyrenoidigerum.ctg17750.p1  ORF type:complete len:420 (-),score=94.54 Plantae.Rhodophyta-Purpureofilum_apyrenoidigerum.ctg17750:191-1450(-)
MDAENRTLASPVLAQRSTPILYRKLSELYDVQEDVLGNGGRGKVVRAVRKTDGLEVAVKIIAKRDLDRWSQTMVAREVFALDILRKSNNRNIVEFVEALEDQKYVYIVTEFLKGGNLYVRLQKNCGVLKECEALELAKQMCNALKALHEQNMSHRDIKLENFVFATGKNELEPCLKLIDFGLVYLTQPGKASLAQRPCGTMHYLSPEVASQKSYVPEEVDMWGIGVVLYALLSRKLPFLDSNKSVLRDKIRYSEVSFTGSDWSVVSSNTKSLIRKLLNKKGSERPNVSETLMLIDGCLKSADVSDIEDDDDNEETEDFRISDMLRANVSDDRDDRQSRCLSEHAEKSHKRQRSSSDMIRALLDGLMSSKKRDRDAGLENLSEDNIMEDENPSNIDPEAAEDLQPKQGFFDSLCQAYGNI